MAIMVIVRGTCGCTFGMGAPIKGTLWGAHGRRSRNLTWGSLGTDLGILARSLLR